MTSVMKGVLGLSIVAGFGSAALAGGEDYDVSPEVVGGAIAVNAYFDEDELEVNNVRVFGYAFGEDPLLPLNELQHPGLHPLPGSGFAPGSQIGVVALSTLQYWDGAGSPAFAAAGAGVNLTYGFGSSSAALTGSSVPGNVINLGPVDASGEFDDHLDTDITLSAAPGIYYFSAKLNTTTPGVTESPSIYFAFAYNADEDALDAAKVFLRDTFAPGTVLPVVPEPSTASLLGAALAGLLRRSRR